MPTRRLSLPRRMVCDFLRAGRRAESVTFERVVSLPAVVAARQAADPRPGWAVVFAKAAGVAAERCPELKQAFIPHPWPRLSEYPMPVAGVVVAKEHAGEEYLFVLHLHDPGKKTLAELDTRVRKAKDEPVAKTGAFRRAVRVGKLPWPVRPLVWDLLDWSGNLRAAHLGTFGVSVTGGWGATALTLRTPWAVALHTGTFAPDGTLPLRVTFDHRVLDGRAACRILAGIEAALSGPVRAELEGMRPGGAASG